MSLRDQNLKPVVIANTTKVGPTSLRQAASSVVARPTGAGLKAIERATAHAPMRRNGYLGFIIDATGSRSDTWNKAQEIQANMFMETAQYGKLKIKLIHFGGSAINDHDWSEDPEEVAKMMREVECKCGSTQILEGLNLFLENNGGNKANSLIVIGDSFEENEQDIPVITEKLAAERIKVFTFLEGHNDTAEEAFRELAKRTGGTFARFGADMSLKDLCAGVALLSTGGVNALNQLKNAAARTLLLNTPKM